MYIIQTTYSVHKQKGCIWNAIFFYGKWNKKLSNMVFLNIILKLFLRKMVIQHQQITGFPHPVKILQGRKERKKKENYHFLENIWYYIYIYDITFQYK